MNITKDSTREERLEAIRLAGERLKAKKAQEARLVRDYTESYLPKGYPASTGYDDVIKNDYENVHHWTDASKYADEYYGETMRETTRFDNDWD